MLPEWYDPEKDETLKHTKRAINRMNWESEEDMKRDVEENRELYEAMTDTPIQPQTFVEVAKEIKNGRPEKRLEENGFVIPQWRCVWVGYKEHENTYITARMAKSTETIGRSSSRIQTQQNTYVRAEFKRIEIEDIDAEEIKEKFGEAREIDTGYYSGYRVAHIEDVLEDIFKWYSQSEQ